MIEVRDLRDMARLMLETPGDWYMVECGPVEQRPEIGKHAERIRKHRVPEFQWVLLASGKLGQWEATVRTMRDVDPSECVRCYVRFCPADDDDDG